MTKQITIVVIGSLRVNPKAPFLTAADNKLNLFTYIFYLNFSEKISFETPKKFVKLLY